MSQIYRLSHKSIVISHMDEITTDSLQILQLAILYPKSACIFKVNDIQRPRQYENAVKSKESAREEIEVLILR